MSVQHIVIGLGSNLGNPIENLRGAIRELRNIAQVTKISNLYESDAQLKAESPHNWNQSYLNACCLLQSVSLTPNDLLKKVKEIEERFGKRSGEIWSPRHLDLDILYWQQDKVPLFWDTDDLKIPHRFVTERPFALMPLLEVFPEAKLEKPEWLLEGKRKPYNTQISQNFFWPRLMGIINLTPDSFSDGDENLNIDSVSEQIESLLDQGAEILDFGAQSTRPGAIQLSAEQEWQRLHRFIPTIESAKKTRNFQISLDTFRPFVAENFLQKIPWDYLNDVTGLTDSQMIETIKRTDKKAIVMHSLGVPPTKEIHLDSSKNPIHELRDWWKVRQRNLLDLGLNDSQLIFDPGIGFGKTKAQSFFILQNLEQFYPIKNEILIGHSRKSFLSLLTDNSAKERDPETALVTKDLNQAYVQYLRLHHIASQKNALRGGQ